MLSKTTGKWQLLRFFDITLDNAERLYRLYDLFNDRLLYLNRYLLFDLNIFYRCLYFLLNWYLFNLLDNFFLLFNFYLLYLFGRFDWRWRHLNMNRLYFLDVFLLLFFLNSLNRLWFFRLLRYFRLHNDWFYNWGIIRH